MPTNNNASVDSSVRQHLVSINISEEEIIKALNSLDPDKSSGIDTISPRVLKKCAYSLCGPLRHLYVRSLSKHIILLDWCTHAVHKSGDKSLVNNYSPNHYLTVNLQQSHPPHLEFPYTQTIGILKKQIHNSTTVSIIFDVIMSSDYLTDIIYFDFEKAFDSVPHNELLFKLKSIFVAMV